jgi:Ca-activated chloride channel family protein
MRSVLTWLALASPALAQELVGEGDLRIQRHEVVTEIHDRVALTTVSQVFVNHAGAVREGTYLFPVPLGASIIEFEMWINGRTMKGEMLEREAAEAVYQKIVAKAKDPGILDQVSDGVWRVRVFPIPGNGGEMKFRTRYIELLPCLGGTTTYTYPLRLGRAKAPAMDAFSVVVRAIAPVPMTKIEGGRFSVTRKSPTEFTATLDREHAVFQGDPSVSFESGEGQGGLSIMAHRRAGEDGHFLLSVRPDPGTVVLEELPREVLYLVDASGSIDEKLFRRVTAAVAADVRELPARDRFNIVAFNRRLEKFQPAFVTPSATRAREAGAFLERLKPEGRTNLEACLASLLGEAGDHPRIVILITDGSPSAGPLSGREIAASCLEKCPGSTMIFTVPVGDSEGSLLETLAFRTGGRCLDPDLDRLPANLRLVHERLGLPVMTDVGVDLGHAGAYGVHQPRVLFKNEPILVSGRYRTPGTYEVRLTGRVGSRAVTLRQQVTFPDLEERWGAAAYIWAGREMSSILADLYLDGERPDLRQAAVRLSKEYRIASPFTAFLVLENDEMYAQAGLPRTFGKTREVFLKPLARKPTPGLKPLIDGVPHLLPILSAPSQDALLPALKWFAAARDGFMGTSQGICPLGETGVNALALMALIGADTYTLSDSDRGSVDGAFKRIMDALRHAQAPDGLIGSSLVDHALATEALGRVVRWRGSDRALRRSLQNAVAYLSDHVDRRSAALAGPALVLARDLGFEVDAETLSQVDALLDVKSEALYVRAKAAMDRRASLDPKLTSAVSRLLQQDASDPATAFFGSEAILAWKGDGSPEWKAWEKKLDGYRRINKSESGSWVAKGWREESRGASTALLALLLELRDSHAF